MKKDLQSITISIADQHGIGMDIPPETEALVRKVEHNVNKLWASWCEKYKKKSHQEVLAMVTFQYARHYYDLIEKIDANQKAIIDFEKELDSILLDIK